MICTPGFAQSAGTSITNTAQVRFTYGGNASELLSNSVSTSVQPLIDAAIQTVEVKRGTIDGGVEGYLYGFEVSNPGNAQDTYDLLADFTRLVARVAGLWLDADRDGRISAGDMRISSSTLALNAGQKVRILVTAEAAGEMQLTATSMNQNPLAILRHRSATAFLTPSLPQDEKQARLEKTQEVDLRGAEHPTHGTLITYSLTARLPAELEAADIRVSDTIPAGTTYVPDSLTLNGTVLSDATYFNPSTGLIAVALSGTVNSDTIHTVRFQVRIN